MATTIMNERGDIIMVFKSIRSQMMTYLLIAVLSLFGLLGIIVNNELEKIPDDMMVQYQEIVNARADMVDAKLENLINEMKMISQSTIVQSMDMKAIQEFLPSLIVDGHHRNMTIAKLDGAAWTTDGDEINISEQEQYEKIILGEEEHWISEPFISPFADPDIPIVIISHQVINDDVLVGIVNSVIEIDFLASVVESIDLGESGVAWIVDKEGKIIVHPDEKIGMNSHISELISLPSRTEEANDNNLHWFEHQNDREEDLFTFYKEIDESMGWSLLLSVNTEEVLSEITGVRMKILAAFLIGLCLIILFSYFYSNSISKPILKLKNVFEEAEAGHADIVADETVRNEIGVAGKSFNKMLRKIKTLTYYDPLTNLYNFNGFLLEIPYQIQRIRETYPVVTIVVVSIDDFKQINSIRGYLEGNMVLRMFSNRLKKWIDNNEKIGRYFGDEFIILMKDETEERLTFRIQELWLESSKELTLEEMQLRLKVSIGVSISKQREPNIEDMVNEANMAKLHVKKNGGNNYQFYNDEINELINNEQKIENALYRAIENEELYLVYQPIVHLKTNKVIGNEALIRWNNQQFIDVSPSKIIEIAEQSGLILDIGKWVLTEALRQNKRWQDKGFNPMFISINISVLQFDQLDFVDMIGQTINEIGLDQNLIELEITETIAMTMVDKKLEKMEQLKDLGVKIAIDDFGTGYSSLAYFTKFPISTMKIDRTFVKDITFDDNARTVITTIISMAKSLGIATTAEGVEHVEQKQFLMEQGCEQMQGYLFSKPVKAEKLESLLIRGDESSDRER